MSESCSCHINPPCHYCENSVYCNKCGERTCSFYELQNMQEESPEITMDNILCDKCEAKEPQK